MAITTVSTAALTLLAGGRRPLRVHSVFPSGVNLRCGDYLVHAGSRRDGGAASLGVTAQDVKLLGRHPAWEWTGEALVADDGSATVGLAATVDRYPTSPPTAPVLSAATPGRLERARAAADGVSWFDTEPGLGLGLPQLRAALSALVQQAPEAAVLVHGIIGLGAGLTPSADDAVVGALCLLSSLGRVPPGFLDDLRVWLRGAGVASTTDVSMSYLRLAVEGAFSAPLNRAVAALTASSTQADLEESVLALCDLGATSGLDTTRGLQIVCELLTRPLRGPEAS